MVQFLNTDNGQTIEATGAWVERFDRACNMQRVEPEPVEVEVMELASLKVDELRALAAERGVDLEGATKKADIIVAIEAAEDPDAELKRSSREAE